MTYVVHSSTHQHEIRSQYMAVIVLQPFKQMMYDHRMHFTVDGRFNEHNAATNTAITAVPS